ncbi:MAG: [protein-PII] uridylyltransferase [SAR86 cluster bacterium]|uniref:Bifunctional uridylyltransferase/uridylyl-removing enzyme n=1 Tax=SAR86 cluster bacterium TaxID=2030880 RepID=A0A520N1X1_9GAMM|nr:MAG: [protein-PII] uridylyltransferase [SAR86 cluster bacterium]|tara:strand:+ start:846 stop:3362 length:2517 start_codon:yes stop_codon:yes gene_type:complete
MNDQIEIIKKDFKTNLKKNYSKPSKINNYLEKYSDQVEKIIKDKFIELHLDKNFAVYANGGFGRKEMFPSSDIDISIIQINKSENFTGLEKLISYLWDQGFKVGHSVRSISDLKEIAKKDLKEFTSYLSRRPIISNHDVDKNISNSLRRIWSKNNFYKMKYSEQQSRHDNFHSSAYNLEPDLKESPGTMRDFQTSLWILQHCYGLNSNDSIINAKVFTEEFSESLKAYNFIKLLRFATNIETNKNRLSFEAQIEVSKELHDGTKKSTTMLESMMKNYYEMASAISYFNEIIFEKYVEKPQSIFFKKIYGIYKNKNKIGIKNTDLKKNKNLIFQIFLEIGKSKVIDLIDTETKSLIKNNTKLIDDEFRLNPAFSAQFIEILRSKYNLSSILKTMKTLGVLQAYIPDFSNVVGQMQFDLFHVYTVDEHTFKVVRNMRQMKLYKKSGFELEHEIINKIPKIELLYIAGIFHDLGKGKGGDHSEIGAKASFNFAKRIGLSSTNANLISWLVKNHLIMSSISQKKDIGDPDTINTFIEQIDQIEQLDYLYILTINDIRATNPALWNGWKHQLLKDLYTRARSRINKEPFKESSKIAFDRKQNALKAFDNSDKSILENYFANLDTSYFNKNPSDSLQWQSKLIINDKNNKIIIGCKNVFENLIEIFVKVKNAPGLFYKLAKIFEHSALEVIDANIFTSIDNSFAANTFITKTTYHDRTLTKSDLNDLAKKIEEKFVDFDKIENSKKSSKSLASFEKVINIHDSVNKNKGINLITIETIDSQGLLSKIADVFLKNDVSIFSARINTLGEKVEDSFEIENMDKTIISAEKIQKIKNDLKNCLKQIN